MKQEEEVLKKEWAPKFPTISLFVRWAKKSTTNYNSDSLSLLRTIAEQAEMQPIEFLDSVRTYRVSLGGESDMYGVKFAFAKKTVSGSKTLQPYNDKIETVIQGLKYTCQLLEDAIHQSSTSTMAKIGRNVSKKAESEQFFTLGDEEDSILLEQEGTSSKSKKFKAAPMLCCHLINTFDIRLWSEVEHRFLAYHVTYFVFSNALLSHPALISPRVSKRIFGDWLFKTGLNL